MKEIFICNTYYHVLITTIKAFNKKENKPTILIGSETSDNNIINDFRLIENLRQSNLFYEVIICPDLYKEIEAKTKHIKNFNLLLKQYEKFSQKLPVKLQNYDEIYLYCDSAFFGKIVNSLDLKYHLLEDGTDTFNRNPYLLKYIANKIYYRFKKRFFNHCRLGQSRNIIDVEVNSKKGVAFDQKLIVKPKKDMFDALSVDEKNILIDIFMPNLNIDLSKFDSMIITQPIFDCGKIYSMNAQIELYYDIIKEHCQGQKVLIKVHPRDHADYSKLGDNICMLNTPFPLEILNFIQSIHFKTAITIYSTSLYLVENADNKIFLGRKWLKKHIKELKNRGVA